MSTAAPANARTTTPAIMMTTLTAWVTMATMAMLNATMTNDLYEATVGLRPCFYQHK